MKEKSTYLSKLVFFFQSTGELCHKIDKYHMTSVICTIQETKQKNIEGKKREANHKTDS